MKKIKDINRKLQADKTNAGDIHGLYQDIYLTDTKKEIDDSKSKYISLRKNQN